MAKILIIDDEEDLRQGLGIILSDLEGYEVVLAENGRVGVELARSEMPDLVLCDIRMPVLDGFGVLAELQQDKETAAIPFIFLTARKDRNTARTGMGRGADDYITKPFERRELMAAIQARLNKREIITSHYEEKLESLRGNILMALPHELRTPLASIVGYGDLLVQNADDFSSEEISEYAAAIVMAGQRLHHLLENYIIFAQLELMANDVTHYDQLRQVYQAQPDEIIRVVVQGKTAVNQRHVQLHLQAGSVTLPMSNDYFLKIIEELLDNACKFSPDDSTIEIYTAVSETRYSLKVENSGRGMTPEQIRNIGLYMQFERRIYEQQGSGMGLVIVKRLVELHGGDISFASVPDEVTAITITIPL